MKQVCTRISAEDVSRQLALCDELHLWLDNYKETRLAFVDTYGCQQNEADSERLRGFLARMGYGFTTDEHEADLVLLNTCAIREHAEQRVFGNVGALVHSKRKNPKQIICVCGCMAQNPKSAERFRRSFPHVSLVFGTHALWQFPELLYQYLSKGKRIFSYEDSSGNIAEGLPVIRQKEGKAWVSVMYGCNNFCSYCIVPYVRGRERSRFPAIIVEEVRGLLAEGYRDITLVGQNVNSYGKDLPEPTSFAQLLETLDQLDGEFLLRFMTSHPKDASPALFDVMAKCRHIAPQLHLPFQSGSSRVLRAMNRGYTREQYLSLIHALRQRIPNIVLTSDVIVGFPGETQEEFEETLSLIEEVRFDALFTFIFSPRSGTPAATLDDPMPSTQKSENFQRLLARQNEISAEKHQNYIGKTYDCFIDGQDAQGVLAGRTSGGRLVHCQGGDASLIGQVVPVHIHNASTWALFGTIGDLQA